jgi:Mu-like prophage major head subunit gpT
MTINTSSFAKALFPGVNAWYGKSYSEYPLEVEQLFEKQTSTRAWEEDVGVSGFGLAVIKTEGAAVSFDNERQAFTTRYTPVVYALGFVITREMRDDDLYDVVGQRKAQSLAFSVRQTQETVGANVYNRAFTSGYTGGDGSILAVSSHPNVAGGTQSNVLATASDLSEAALEQAWIDISLLKNDRGLQIALKPTQLIVSPQQAFEAHRILKSNLRVGTPNNDTNAIKDMGNYSMGVTVNHYLTDVDAWFIRTNAPHGMKRIVRDAPEFGTENDWDTENAKFKTRYREAYGWSDYRGLFASAGA